ncbi:MAG: hypothetical protein WCJ61_03905, partial [Paludibacter sp.]
NADNTPNWGQILIGAPQVNVYTGNALTDIDKTADVGGAFSILTGLVKKYNLKLIIDQTTGVEEITLSANFNVTDYSATKFGLIGNSYFLNNTLGGTKANWNTCWKDVVNNVQASAPVISGNGLVNTWSFPNVYLDGANQGMFKFCIPNTDYSPNWAQTIIGYPQINAYTGNATADVDKTSDVGGAFTILTSGLIKKFNLKLIIDQTSGIEKLTLNMENSYNTAVPLVEENQAVIVDYRIYTLQGTLISTSTPYNGLKLQDIKAKLSNGVYLINAKLMNGESRNYKVITQ